ncbi:MAG: hypothetical protein WKF36_07485 [Candidatus Nitrosocosmicus sp.]
MATGKEDNDVNLEYVLLSGIDGELLEIDYENSIALNVSGVIRQDTINRLNTYSDKIEDFLSKERGCDNIHFHNSFSIPTRIHMNNKKSHEQQEIKIKRL